jgi:phosphosulfolactate synthase (CoM biosynthesis protein A)
MQDIVKQELTVGNMVVFNPPKYKGLVTGTIVGFTPKMIKVKYSDYGVSSWVDGVRVDWDTTNVYPTDVMKVDEQIAFIHTLSV